jgi:hypothetical protein
MCIIWFQYTDHSQREADPCLGSCYIFLFITFVKFIVFTMVSIECFLIIADLIERKKSVSFAVHYCLRENSSMISVQGQLNPSILHICLLNLHFSIII